MKQILFVSCAIFVLLGASSCTSPAVPVTKNIMESEIEDLEENLQNVIDENDDTKNSIETQESTKDEKKLSVGESKSPKEDLTITYKIYKKHIADFPNSERLPTKERYVKYLEKNIKSENIKIIGDLELWQRVMYLKSSDFSEEQASWVFAYPIQQENSESIVRCGVDYRMGSIYSWDTEGGEYELSPVKPLYVINTPEEALKYVKKYIVYQDTELELIPGQSGEDYYKQFPHYRSQIKEYGGIQTTSCIDILSDQVFSYSVHCYEIVMYKDGEGHRATSHWLDVYKNGFIVNDTNHVWIIDEALYD